MCSVLSKLGRAMFHFRQWIQDSCLVLSACFLGFLPAAVSHPCFLPRTTSKNTTHVRIEKRRYLKDSLPGQLKLPERLLKPATYQRWTLVESTRACFGMPLLSHVAPLQVLTHPAPSHLVVHYIELAAAHGSAIGSIMQRALTIKALHAHAERPVVHSQELCESWRSG